MTGTAVNQKVHVLFATVTGNAEEIARRIHSELPLNSVPQGVLCAVQDYAKTGLGTAKAANDVFIFVAATTGDGDAPDTSRPFMRFLRKKEPALLKGIPFTVLGLGDTNYENFCKNGKKIEAAMKKLGASPFYKRGDADDGVGLEEVVEPWVDGLWSTLRNKLQPIMPISIDEIVREVTNSELGFDEADLPKLLEPSSKAVILTGGTTTPKLSVSQFYSESKARVTSVTGARKLTADGSEKTVWHMEVTAEQAVGHNEEYRAGDAFGVLVENNAEEVFELLKFVKEDESDTLQLQNLDGAELATGSVRQLLSERVDIRCLPKKTLLRALAQHCSDASERARLLHLSSKPGRKQYSAEVLGASLSVLQLLRTVAPSCRPPVALLLDQLPPLAPRWYSATSSPGLDGADSLHFAFSVVAGGLATPALAARCARFAAGGRPPPVVLVPRESDATGHFHPPDALSTSYVMVGPGTGVAPFRGFLRERAALLAADTAGPVGEALLFFGCRDERLDFLYREELEGLRDRGVLSVLDVAFSRAGPSKVYVQHRLRERAKEVADILAGGGSLFVCGDGGGMARGVDDAVADILAEHLFEGNLKLAKAEMKKMSEEHRYVRDIWYFG